LITPINIGTDHIRGSVDAPISIVEYGDYECPYAGMAYPIVKEIMKKFNNKVYFVFRNFPLNDIHPNAQHSAEAAEAAAAQDKFWEMHDYLFEHQKALDDSHLLQYAERLGIDSGVQGTPTFFVNGNRYQDSWDLETFSNFLKTLNK
jgi:protein-disulfide isomerase